MAGARISSQQLAAGSVAAAGFEGRSRRGARVEDAHHLGRRGVGQILDAAMEVLVQRFGVCVGIATMVWLPFRLGTELIARSSAPEEVLLLWGTTNVAPQLLTTGFVCTLVGGHLVGRRVPLGEVLMSGLTRAPGLGVIMLVNLMAAIVLVCPCIVSSYAAYWLFAVVPAVYVLERGQLLPRGGPGGPVGGALRWLGEAFVAVGRGIRLVWGGTSFLRWIGWFAVANVAIIVPLTAAPSALDYPGVREQISTVVDLDGPAGLLLVLVGSLFFGIGTAYTAIVMTVYYVDERVRKEGLDLEIALRRLAGRGTPQGEAPA